ncbi:hypothetical protein ACQYAD_07255 [Neobacillus sp. SM06]|uniref:hypothetical protein n=1 Tax=Neobacillus sp. SM06 TaxID=3422492 RepID=UPI003D270D1A
METDKFYRLFFWLFGVVMAAAGGVYAITYLNLLPAGYTFDEYLLFLSRRIEFYLLPLGLIVITASIFHPENEKEK